MWDFCKLSFNLILQLYFAFIYLGLFSMQSEFNSNNELFRFLLSLVIVQINIIMLLNILLLQRNMRLTCLNLFVIAWICAIFICITLTSGARFLKDLNYVLLWPLTYCYSFLLFKRGILSTSKVVDIMTVLCVYSMILFGVFFTDKANENLGIISIEGMNRIFYALLFIPWIYLNEKKGVQNVILFILLIIVFVSMKRSALMSFSVIYLFSFLFNRNGSKSPKFLLRVSLAFVVLLAAYLFVDSYLDGGVTERLERVEDDGGSGRTDIWMAVWHNILNSSVSEILIGHGHNTVIMSKTLSGVPLSAHNDFLEILYDYGFFLFLLFIVFSFLLWKKLFFLYKNRFPYFFSYLSALVLFFTMTNLSHLILYPSYIVFLSFLWGMVEAKTSV